MTKLTQKVTYDLEDNPTINKTVIIGATLRYLNAHVLQPLLTSDETGYFYKSFSQSTNTIHCHDDKKSIVLASIESFYAQLIGKTFDQIIIDDVGISLYANDKGLFNDVLTEIIAMANSTLSTTNAGIIFTSDIIF